MTLLTESLTLTNGYPIPLVGLGTWQMSQEEAERSVAYALQQGYRHIDTARTYGNEEGVGRGIINSGVPREEIFLTTKVSAFSKSFEEANQDIKDSLEALLTDYLDLVIIHAPRPWDEMFLADQPIHHHYYRENKEVWHALEEAYEEGKVKAIGVSNFSIDDLDHLFANVRFKPILNQIKYHVGHRDEQLVQFCQENDMVVEAYSPLGTGRLLTNPDIQKIADKYDKSVPQIAIRYAYQRGLVVLPKSVHEEYIVQNADLNFQLSLDDMDNLNRMKL